MPYPVSTLSPPIVPTDLTSFKTRGISEVERDLRQKLTEIREDYLRAIDHFNWNKLVYEAEIRFEPVVGEIYHLYDMRGRRALSMICPDQWPHRHLATVRLNYDRQWLVVTRARGLIPPGSSEPWSLPDELMVCFFRGWKKFPRNRKIGLVRSGSGL